MRRFKLYINQAAEHSQYLLPTVGCLVQWGSVVRFKIIEMTEKDQTDNKTLRMTFRNWDIIGEEIPGYEVPSYLLERAKSGKVTVQPVDSLEVGA